jgi:hypothetical protein
MLRSVAALFSFFLAASVFTFAQTNPVAGNLPFATQVGGPFDYVDLATAIF